MEYQEWKKKKERSDNAWTGIIILAFICFWPAGIALVVLKNAGKLPILGTGQTLQQWRQTLAHLAAAGSRAAPGQPKAAGPGQAKAEIWRGAAGHGRYAGRTRSAADRHGAPGRAQLLGPLARLRRGDDIPGWRQRPGDFGWAAEKAVPAATAICGDDRPGLRLSLHLRIGRPSPPAL